MTQKHILFICLLLRLLFLHSQNSVLKGIVVDISNNQPIPYASIKIESEKGKGIASDSTGMFILSLPAEEAVKIIITHVNYHPRSFIVSSEAPTHTFYLLPRDIELPEMEVVSESTHKINMTKIDPRIIHTVTSASGGIEAVLKTLPGVSTNNELSSQYNVRGGNYDENLIYVNDVEIYRPLIVTAGQQEGLSFINPDMVENIRFSAGGFDARYGDKMSSVLDIKYKEPIEKRQSVTASLLGTHLHAEGSTLHHRFTYNIGLRYHTNQYLLGALDTKGNYKPAFSDWQSYFTYDISEKWQVGWLSLWAINRYLFIPQKQETEFGTINQALKLTVYFEGQQISRYNTIFHSIVNKFYDKRKEIKWIHSFIKSKEEETYTIEGAYRIDALEKDLSKSNFGETAYTIGVGSYLQHARNKLSVTIYRSECKSRWFEQQHPVSAGIGAEYNKIEDTYKEWALIDSADYVIPRPQDSVGYTDPSQQPKPILSLPYSVYTKNQIAFLRLYGYLQREWNLKNSAGHIFYLNTGLRASYTSFNQEFFITPRLQVNYHPAWKRNMIFRGSAGLYYQPPFYRELRNFDGSLNRSLRAQQSYHLILGFDYQFAAWQRPFKWTMETYYKHMPLVVPYEVNDVRIRYFPYEKATAYAAGIDMKINGEFVKGTDSWFSLSIMQTKENLRNDFYTIAYNTDGEVIIPGYTYNTIINRIDTIYVGYIPRPTDQLVNFGFFFQDYIPKFPDLTMSMTLFFGSGLPFGPPDHSRYKDTLRFPFYRRADLGLHYHIKKPDSRKEYKKPWLQKIHACWIGIEIFNLFQVNNTISYTWLKDVNNRLYAIPNYLTPRRINVKFHITF